jgi:hypothetical protein
LVPKELPRKKETNTPRLSIQQEWQERSWQWTSQQQESFDYIKRAVSENAMSSADPKKQYHLSTDASKYGLGGVLFQLHDIPEGTEASPKHYDRERIIMFISFKLSDMESRYGNTEREALAVVHCLAEVRWLVIGSPYSVKLYTDHQALLSILSKGAKASSRIIQWQD